MKDGGLYSKTTKNTTSHQTASKSSECKEKQMLEKDQTKENTFQYTSGMKGNELSIPNITSSLNMSSQSSDGALAVKEKQHLPL